MPIEVDLEAGIVALALSHCGIIDWSCDGCEGLRQQDLHCSGESEYPLFEWNEHEWHSCPLKWITPEVYNFYDEFSYYEVYPNSAPNYGDVNPRYWEALKTYKNVVNTVEREKMSNKPSPIANERKTTNSLSSLKQEFSKKKK